MPERMPTFLALVLTLMLAACGGSGGDDTPTGNAPTIGSVGPSSGSPAGGETVTLTGTGFAEPGAGTPIVRFGGVDATNVVVIDNNTLTCTVPPHAPGTVDIEIVTNHGTYVLPGAYTYGPARTSEALLLTSTNEGGVGAWSRKPRP